ncbi:hypothetical protein [Novosphingobium sp.]|uniref:hypothetical protein n=1 Tax=Novosphingobium sp. TaxID=1874826 RepID=UPI00333F7C1E
MLRTIVIVLSALVFGVVMVADWMLGRVCVAPTIATGLLLIGVVFERYRYQRLLDRAPGAGWQATEERFIDPETGKTVTVFFNAATGERRYVAGGERAGSA